jgi:hypothetical protein
MGRFSHRAAIPTDSDTADSTKTKLICGATRATLSHDHVDGLPAGASS